MPGGPVRRRRAQPTIMAEVPAEVGWLLLLASRSPSFDAPRHLRFARMSRNVRPDLILWGSGPGWPGTEPPFPAQPGVHRFRVSVRAREGGPGMSVYVGIDVHRKRSQVAVVDEAGEVRVNRNVPNGVEPVLAAMGKVPVGTAGGFGGGL